MGTRVCLAGSESESECVCPVRCHHLSFILNVLCADEDEDVVFASN